MTRLIRSEGTCYGLDIDRLDKIELDLIVTAMDVHLGSSDPVVERLERLGDDDYAIRNLSAKQVDTILWALEQEDKKSPTPYDPTCPEQEIRFEIHAGLQSDLMRLGLWPR